VLRPDPIELAEKQLERDKAATARFPGLFERKVARMAVSPLRYLRGTAPLFYELLSEHPELSEGPAGEGWLCGDAHLENFGVYRTERGTAKSNSDTSTPDPAVFDINDFDEAFVGPFRFDVLRLTTSLILGGRELGASGGQSLALSVRLLDAYVGAAFDGLAPPTVPAPVRRLLDKVAQRSQRDLLDRRTTVVAGARHFVLGERYRELSPDVRRAATEAFAAYVQKLDTRFPKERFEVLDMAFRVAGTGSLGTLRVAVLTRGKGGTDGAWIFDMKQESAPSAAALIEPPPSEPAERVHAGVVACLEHPPRMVGTTKLDGASLFVRRLAPQEDKLDLSRLKEEDLEALAEYLGFLLGRAHRRGKTKLPSEPWSTKDRRTLLDRAIVISGIHEASYLAMCRLK
jgi:uncharacterized protein (DUF2252 family)